MTFSNQSMRAPVPGKPHLALVGGFWRVSPMHRYGRAQHGEYTRVWWRAAHRWADRLNNRAVEA